jgi:hypothetical protein
VTEKTASSLLEKKALIAVSRQIATIPNATSVRNTHPVKTTVW